MHLKTIGESRGTSASKQNANKLMALHCMNERKNCVILQILSIDFKEEARTKHYQFSVLSVGKDLYPHTCVYIILSISLSVTSGECLLSKLSLTLSRRRSLSCRNQSIVSIR